MFIHAKAGLSRRRAGDERAVRVYFAYRDGEKSEEGEEGEEGEESRPAPVVVT